MRILTEIGTNTENDKKFTRIMFTLILFMGVYSLILMPNYLDVPRISDNHTFKYGIDTFNDPRVVVKNPDFFVISFSDKKITNIENIIIYIFMLWSFLRLIDLIYFLEKYKKDETLKNN